MPKMDVDLLISEVFSRKQLWDQKHRQHHNRFVLDKMWDEVATQLKSTREAVRSKWKALRDAYRRELKKMPEKQSGEEGSQVISSWAHFQTLSFLKDQFIPRPSCGNLSDSPITHFAMNEDNITDSYLAETSEDCKEPFADSPLEEDVEREHSTSSQTPYSRKRKRETEDPIGDALVSLEEMKIKLLQNQSMTQDDDQHFVNSLLPYMRALPVRDKLLLRIKIQELVYKFVCDVESREESPTTTRISVPDENQVDQPGTQVQHNHSQQ